MAEAVAPADKPATPEVPSAFSLFKPSWEGLKLNIFELIMVFLVPWLIFIFLIIIGGVVANNSSAAAAVVLAVVAIATLVYLALVGPAFVHIQLKSARLEKASLASAWETSKKFWWRFLLVSIAVGLTVVVGLILLIVPGIIFIRRYFLAQYVLIDQDLGVTDSMRASNQLSRGRAMAIFGIFGVDILIGIPSVIPVVGSFITFVLQAVYFCAPAIRYDQLKALAKN